MTSPGPPPEGPTPQGPLGGYGTGLPPGTAAPAGSAGSGAPSDPLAIASLATGASGVVFNCCCGPLSVALGLTAVVLGLVSISRINAEPERFGAKGMAISGIATGVVAMLVYPILIVFSVALPFAPSLTSWP